MMMLDCMDANGVPVEIGDCVMAEGEKLAVMGIFECMGDWCLSLGELVGGKFADPYAIESWRVCKMARSRK